MATPDYRIDLAVSAKDMAAAIIQQQEVLKKIYDKALSAATEANFSRKKFKGLEDSMSAATKEMAQQQLKLTRLQIQLQNKNLSDEMKKRIAAQLEEIKIRRKFLEDQAKGALESARKLAAKEKEQHEKRLKTTSTVSRWAKGSSGAGGGLGALLKQLGSGDISGAAGTLGRGAKGAKGALENKVARGGMGADAAHATLKIVNKLGSSLAVLGPALAAIGAVAGGLMFLVNVFLEADKLVKEMNSSLLKSNVVASDLGASWENLEDRLEEVRGSFNNLSFMNSWKILPKEAMKIVDAYGAAGVKVSDFTAGLDKAADRQEKLRGVAETALIYANLVGMTGEEVATKMGEYMDDLSMSLSSVRDGFSSIYRVANESGYSTKKFFGMVLQASSGLSMYNVRLDQTANLLSKMTKTLGLEKGFKVFQNVMSKMSNRSVKDAAVEIVATGEDSDKVANADINSALVRIMGVALNEMDTLNFRVSFEDAARAAGVKMNLSSGEALAKSVKKIDATQRLALQAQLDLRAITKDQMKFVNKFVDNVKNLAPGAQAGADTVTMAGSMKHLDSKGHFIRVMREAEAKAKLANENVHNLSGWGVSAAEARGDMDIREVAAVMDKMQSGLKHVLERAGRGSVITEEENKELVRQFELGIRTAANGALEVVTGHIDSLGGLKLDTRGKAIKDIYDLLEADNSWFEELTNKNDSEEVTLSKKIAENTNEAAKILEAIRDGILLDIYNAVQGIFSFLSFDKVKEITKIVRTAAKEAMVKEELALKQIQEAKGKAQKIRSDDIGDPRKKAQFLQFVENLEKDEAKVRGRIAQLRAGELKLQNEIATDRDAVEDKYKRKFFKKDREIRDQKIRNSFLGDTSESVARVSGTRKSNMGSFQNTNFFYAPPEMVKSAQDLTDTIESLVAQKSVSINAADGEDPRISSMMKALGESEIPKSLGISDSNPTLIRDLAKALLTGDISHARQKQFQGNPAILDKILRLEGLHAETKQSIQEVKDAIQMNRIPVIEAALQKPAAHDLLMSMGGGKVNFAHRIDSQDQLGFMAKPGGALSKGGGGGTTVVHNNFWEGKGAFNSMRQLEKAKGRYN